MRRSGLPMCLADVLLLVTTNESGVITKLYYIAKCFSVGHLAFYLQKGRNR